MVMVTRLLHVCKTARGDYGPYSALTTLRTAAACTMHCRRAENVFPGRDGVGFEAARRSCRPCRSLIRRARIKALRSALASSLFSSEPIHGLVLLSCGSYSRVNAHGDRRDMRHGPTSFTVLLSPQANKDSTVLLLSFPMSTCKTPPLVLTTRPAQG